jgi:hypothetical protein
MGFSSRCSDRFVRSSAGRRSNGEGDSCFVAMSRFKKRAFGHKNEPGMRMLAACKLNLDRDRVFYLAGDFHHYERRTINKSVHVVAGGGGAFLHGTRIAPYTDLPPPNAAYPNATSSRKLAVQVPVKLMIGRAGLLVHLALGVLASIEIGASQRGESALLLTSVLMAAGISLVLYLIAMQGQSTRAKRVALAIPFGTVIGLLPIALQFAVPHLPFHLKDGAILVTCAFIGSLVFGFYLTLLTLLGLEHQQSFTVLGHPGYKHFVRICVHPNGKMEVWTIGKDDVFDKGDPMLIDHFEWDPNPNPNPNEQQPKP